MNSPLPPAPRPLDEGDIRLNLGDFEDRFSLDRHGKLKFDGALVETRIGLKRRDFVLACIVAAVTFCNMVASWINALKKPAAPTLLSCPAPTVAVPPVQPAKKETQVPKG